MLYPSVTESSRVRKSSVLAVIFLGIHLTFNAIMFISVLGLNFATTSLFPLFQTFRIIKVGDAFNRFGIFFILFMIMGVFIKVSFFMYGSMLGISQLIKSENTKNLAPLGIVVFITSLLIASNYPQHIYIGQVLTLKYIVLPLAVIIPVIALIVYYLKALLKKRI